MNIDEYINLIEAGEPRIFEELMPLLRMYGWSREQEIMRNIAPGWYTIITPGKHYIYNSPLRGYIRVYNGLDGQWNWRPMPTG